MDASSQPSPGGLADDDVLLRRELWMERLRRRVYESVARQELLAHTLSCLTEMIERQTPRMFACLVFTAESGDQRDRTYQAVANRGGDAMRTHCIDMARRQEMEWPAAAERWEPLAAMPP